MLWYEILDPCIVRKQAETVYKTDKLTTSIVKLYKTWTYKNIDTQAWLYRIPIHKHGCIVSRYTWSIAIFGYLDTYRTSLSTITSWQQGEALGVNYHNCYLSVVPLQADNTYLVVTIFLHKILRRQSGSALDSTELKIRNWKCMDKWPSIKASIWPFIKLLSHFVLFYF